MIDNEVMNVEQRATVARLLEAFPVQPPLYEPNRILSLPIGIEIEVPWRAYFPDLWVEGFPNIPDIQLEAITQICKEREKVLLPKLMKTVECGVPSGADKYWEFAFQPVTDISITVNQVAILQANDLIPPGNHSLHITFGGLRVTKDMYYVAMALESMACDGPRIMAGFHPWMTSMSHGWARKGFAGLFEKEGSHDLQHGYDFGAEIRLLYLPSDSEGLFQLLDYAQVMGDYVASAQAGNRLPEWDRFIERATQIIVDNGLPNRNWRKPHLEPEVWTKFAELLPGMSGDIRWAMRDTMGI